MKKVAIIGGGAAGLMAAAIAGSRGAVNVTLWEQNPFCARKLGITGKGRCNLTNTASVQELSAFIPRGEKFLRTAMYAFPPQQVMEFFEEAGVPLKVERGGRVFPVSDKARDIVNALCGAALRSPLVTLKKQKILSVKPGEKGFCLTHQDGEDTFDRVLIATGGASYTATGSKGDGYRFAAELGHTVTPPRPSLIPLVVKEGFCSDCMGLSLKNTALRVETLGGRKVYEDFGEMLFTHFGVSGPTILSASAYLDFEKEARYRLVLDLKPALTREELDKRVLSDFEENQNRDLVNALDRLLPQKMIRPILAYAGLDERKKVNLIKREERLKFVDCLKALSLTVIGTRSMEEAIVTRGGVVLKEVNPKTMESRLVPGLYFAGEVLYADALTGGFNLQIAFSTGYLAGMSLGEEV